uniref:Ig-like domain-containing protein n=1 Tax=Lates calcarifer TaxID=8187 RepID=A0A4W6F8N5_LATCA
RQKLTQTISLLLCYYSHSIPREVTVRPGEDVTLQCQGPRDSTITLLEWIRPDLKSDGYVFFYRNDRPYENYQHPSFRGRVKLRDKSLLKDGDMSVILKNVTDQDSGAYECRIISSAMEGNERTYKEVRDLINLTVTHSGQLVETLKADVFNIVLLIFCLYGLNHSVLLSLINFSFQHVSFFQ